MVTGSYFKEIIMQEGQVYPTQNSGDLRIIKYVNAFNVTIQFINTHFTKVCRTEHIRNGQVKDPFVLSVCGIGYLGEGKHVCSVKQKVTPAYDKWQAMLQRCYDPKVHEKFPTYIGCTVCAEWHNFQVFAEWFYTQDFVGNELDKDILCKGNKVYSPTTCLLVSKYANIEQAFAKDWVFLSPEGEVVKVYNLTAFAKANNLQRSVMGKVHRGERPHHKQWRKYVT